jgi:hypothetical protein
MLKNLSKLELEIGNKMYQLLCENDSPIEHVKEALFQFQKYIGQIEDQVKATKKAQEEEAKKKEQEKSPEVSNGNQQ